jgi:hypothetical protein
LAFVLLEHAEKNLFGSDFTPANRAIKKGYRMRNNWLPFVILAVSVIGLLSVMGLLGRRDRVERRRRRSHSRLVSKVNRPMVRFSVRPPKK